MKEAMNIQAGNEDHSSLKGDARDVIAFLLGVEPDADAEIE